MSNSQFFGQAILRAPRRWAVLCWIALSVITIVSPLTAQTNSDSSARDQLLGAWRLVSVETFRANGEVIYPFYGKHPEGLIVYDRSGWMSVQIASDPHPTVPTANTREKFSSAAAAEKALAVDGYYAYCGTWNVNAAAGTVTHHIKQSLYPGEWGEDGVRHFVVDGNHLTLTAKTHEMGEDHERKLVWERVRDEQP